jgi:chemotaxis protein methyltransferase CheR
MINPFENCSTTWVETGAGTERSESLKILEAERRQAGGRPPMLSTLATDKNPENLRRAEEGNYPASSLRELPRAVAAACFESRKGGRRFTVLPHLTGNIEWRRHDLLQPPPGGMFSAIFPRNSLLTYYREEIRKAALGPILERLKPGGILVVGSQERLPEGFDFMMQDPRCPHIYRRKQPVADPLSC